MATKKLKLHVVLIISVSWQCPRGLDGVRKSENWLAVLSSDKGVGLGDLSVSPGLT